ncbi:MAG: GGDEF domain-containing protein [Deltaproteobacteria bacterium]|nr:GGDEF domain-containing protein [Deltaproteobacteria bacterium]
MKDDPKDRFEHTCTVELKVSELDLDRPERKAFLTVIRGRGADLGRSIEIARPVIIGRDPACDMPLNDPGVSWHHARITPGGTELYHVSDMGSTNGTRVNGHCFEGAWQLRPGEKIFVCETVVRFSLADAMELGFQREVAQLVSTDPLTGLEAKRVFDDALDQALATAGRSGRPLSVLMMDMDGIKAINDTHGHLFGAHCIQTAGRLIGEIVSAERGHACRFGGDEFTAFLPGTGKARASEIAGRIREAVDSAGMRREGVDLHPTISIGLATFPEDAETVLDMVAAADEALYRAKAKGKNRVST